MTESLSKSIKPGFASLRNCSLLQDDADTVDPPLVILCLSNGV